MADLNFSQWMSASAVGLCAIAVIVGCSPLPPTEAKAPTTMPTTSPATAPSGASIETPVTHVFHGDHAGTAMASGYVAFGDYFIQIPAHMNGIHAGAEGLQCESLRTGKVLQIAIIKRADSNAPVLKLVAAGSPGDHEKKSVGVPIGTEISQVTIGDFSFSRGLSVVKEKHLKMVTLVAADDDNDIIIRAAAGDDAEFADLEECIATFRYASP